MIPDRRHGDLHPDSMEAFLLLERALCPCDAGCVCGWDEVDMDESEEAA